MNSPQEVMNKLYLFVIFILNFVRGKIGPNQNLPRNYEISKQYRDIQSPRCRTALQDIFEILVFSFIFFHF